MTTNVILILIAALQIKHFLGDFVFQSEYILRNRRIWGHPGGLVHAGIHVGMTAPILVVAGMPLHSLAYIITGEFLFHYHLDWAKDRFNCAMGWTPADKLFWWLVGLDQALHQLSYLFIACILAT